MTADTTPPAGTPPAAGTGENQDEKIKNQEEALKRITKEKEELKTQLEEAKKVATPPKPKDEKDPDIRTIIREELNAKEEVNSEVSELMKTHPYLKEHEGKIREFLKDDKRKDLPIEEIVAGAVGVKGLVAIGANLSGDALAAATASETGGAGDAAPNIETEVEKADKAYMESLPDFCR